METLNDICRICLKQDETVVNDVEDWLEVVEGISQIKVRMLTILKNFASHFRLYFLDKCK